VRLHEHDSLLRAARADWIAGPDLRQDYLAHRPHVERVIAQIATWRGRRLKLRYRGVTRNNAWLKRRTALIFISAGFSAVPGAIPVGKGLS